MVVWDWKTGELVQFHDLSGYTLLNLSQVLDLSSTDRSELLQVCAEAIFLDEFRIAVIPDHLAPTELAVFNTRIPQDHPGYLQRLAFPPEFCNRYAQICVDHGQGLGTPNKGEGLLPDPAQAVITIDIWRDEELRFSLVVPTQVLVEQVYSVCTDSPLPWDEWGRDTVTIEFLSDDTYGLFTFVHGARVMIAEPFSARSPGGYYVRTFDFSRCGRGSLPLRGGADGTERRVLFEDGANIRFEPDCKIGPWDDLESLSDGSLICLVSFLANYTGIEVVG